MTAMKNPLCSTNGSDAGLFWLDVANLFRNRALASACLMLSLLGPAAAAQPAAAPPPLKALFVTGGGWHDYAKQEPFLTGQLRQLINASFEVQTSLDRLRHPKFAEGCDVVIYDVCLEEAPDECLQNALQAVREGKPAVLIHCTIHSFKKSPRVKEWEAFCGMTSKVHDPFGPFATTRLDEASPITKLFPTDWKTSGDELYQTISLGTESHPLLRVKSPHEGREHIVCWTRQFGQGRVFATTLGHDMKTCASPDFVRLLANGLLWTCDKLQPDGTPAPGYSATPVSK
jgi:uncharacterized protein